MKLTFTKEGRLTGGSIDYFLLEKTRLVYHAQGERNFHALYQRCVVGCEMDAQRFAYLRGDSVSAPGIDDATNYAEVARELAGLITAAGAEGERLVPGGLASIW